MRVTEEKRPATGVSHDQQDGARVESLKSIRRADPLKLDGTGQGKGNDHDDGGRADGPREPPPPSQGSPGGYGNEPVTSEPCPVRPLGTFKGSFFFFTPLKQFRQVSASKLSNPGVIYSLFETRGDWLEKAFPSSKGWSALN